MTLVSAMRENQLKKKSETAVRARYAARRKANLLRALARPCTSTDNAVDPAQVEQLEAKLESAVGESSQLRDAVARQRAEFDNFRRRTMKEKEQIRDAAREDLLAKLLPVMDNFERAIQSAETAADPKSIRDGVTMVSGQLARILQAEGLERMNALNAPFDPNQHEAIATEERSDIDDNHVCEEMLPGYRYNDKIIRAAMVKVAKAPAETAEA